jgi:hypothetical protein
LYITAAELICEDQQISAHAHAFAHPAESNCPATHKVRPPPSPARVTDVAPHRGQRSAAGACSTLHSAIAVTGKLVRVRGEGLRRFDTAKSASGLRTIPLPRFAVDTLSEHRGLPYLGQQKVIFPSTAGTLRDPDNFGKAWRAVRDELGVADVTTHSFRKTVATLIERRGCRPASVPTTWAMLTCR